MVADLSRAFQGLRLVKRSSPASFVPVRTYAKSTTSRTRTRKDHASDVPRRARRSLLYVPGSDDRKLQKGLQQSNADALIFDLEDSVSANRKEAARGIVKSVLDASADNPKEKFVRINPVDSKLVEGDLETILSSPNLDGIVIPKVTRPEDVLFVASAADSFATRENASKLRIVASVESALALMNLKEIAQSCDRLDALLFAAEDYCADTGIVRTKARTEMLFARSAVVNAAKAYGLQAIDMVCVNFKDEAELERECLEGRQLGFDSKQAIHPAQVDIIQRTFVPSPTEIKRARDILEQYEKAVESGKGAFGLEGVEGGDMIDAPVILQAQSIIAKARAAGIDIERV